MASVDSRFANFQAGVKGEALEAISSYKEGAFKGQVTDTMTVVEIFDRLIASPITTSKEKKVLQLGRSLVSPSDDSPSGDEFLQRVRVYYSAVTGVFREDGTGFRAPPFQILNEDGTLAYIVHGFGGLPLYVPGGSLGEHPTLHLVDDYPKFDAAISTKSPAEFPETTKTKFGPAKWVPKPEVTIVHPSVILDFPDTTNPHPDEIDNYPLVMDYLRKELLAQAKSYKKGAFKDRIKITLSMQKVFKLLIGSNLTSPAEKDTLRRAVEWIDYLDSRFGELYRLSRFHSMLYSGVFIEKVFCVFRDDRASGTDKENKPTGKPGQPLWSIHHVDDGVNDRISIGDDWNAVRTPRGHDRVFGKDDQQLYKVKMTKDGADLYSPLGKVKSLTSENGVLKGIPPEKYVEKGEKVGDLNMTQKTLMKIAESWLGENATRERPRTGMYGMEDVAEGARFLQRKLGRLPTPEELTADSVCCLLKDLAMKTKDMNEAEREFWTTS